MFETVQAREEHRYEQSPLRISPGVPNTGRPIVERGNGTRRRVRRSVGELKQLRGDVVASHVGRGLVERLDGGT